MMYPTTSYVTATEFEKECYKYGVDPQAEAEARRYGHDTTPLENAKAVEALEPQVREAVKDAMNECIKCHGGSIGIICADCVEDEYYQLQAELDDNELQSQLR